MDDLIRLETDVLIVGGGGAGMFAAVAAAGNGAQVLLLDKNVVGRGGATIMAQMTCAAALGEAEPDSPAQHLTDTLEAGRGLCNQDLSALLCETAPDRIRDLEGWKVSWARQENGKINQVMAPGHSRKRCVYVDFLRTGAAISAALRNQTSRNAAIKRISNVTLTDLITRDGKIIAAAGFDIATTTPVIIQTPAVILCTGGMTKMFSRTTAPNNIAGEGVGLALRAGAKIIDIEFLQFYPNGHLAPRMVGLDPTTWEPTRVKLGGRLLNGNREEFMHLYDETAGEGYSTTRDTLTHAMFKEVAAGRGSPHGGVYLSFEHIKPEALKAALGSFIDIFEANKIDITKRPVEVFPIAHYQMGGVEVDIDMATCVPGLYIAGELAGGANGANRLSGNALPEAMTFGHRAGEKAAGYAAETSTTAVSRSEEAAHVDMLKSLLGKNAAQSNSPATLMGELKDLMWSKVGAFRNETDLIQAGERLKIMHETDLDQLAISDDTIHNASMVEWFELRNGLYAARALALAAVMRQESRGAHQRDDFPETLQDLETNQKIYLDADSMMSSFQIEPNGVPSP